MFPNHNFLDQQPSVDHYRYPNMSFGPGTSPTVGLSNTRQDSKEEIPPPIPQRSNPIHSPYQSLGSYGMYNNPYQNHMYGGAAGGLYGYSNFNNPMFNNPTLHGLENASQSAFQSAQTFIGAFSSVSMMLESTLFAVQNTVRAITGVADQFGHLRNHIVSSSVSLIRILRYYFKKVLSWVRLQQPEQYEDHVWENALSGQSSSREESKIYASLLFLTVLVATPWFIWKLLKSLNTERVEDEKWFKGSGEHFLAEVKFPFTARSHEELSLSPNTIIRLAPKHQQPNVRGWLLAADDERQGLVPANYIKILGKNRSEGTKLASSSTDKLDTIYETEASRTENTEVES